MKQITFNIPDEHYASFMEIMKTFNFAKEVNENNLFVSEEDKKIIRDSIIKSKLEEGENWDEIKNSLKIC